MTNRLSSFVRIAASPRLSLGLAGETRSRVARARSRGGAPLSGRPAASRALLRWPIHRRGARAARRRLGFVRERLSQRTPAAWTPTCQPRWYDTSGAFIHGSPRRSLGPTIARLDAWLILRAVNPFAGRGHRAGLPQRRRPAWRQRRRSFGRSTNRSRSSRSRSTSRGDGRSWYAPWQRASAIATFTSSTARADGRSIGRSCWATRAPASS